MNKKKRRPGPGKKTAAAFALIMVLMLVIPVFAEDETAGTDVPAPAAAEKVQAEDTGGEASDAEDGAGAENADTSGADQAAASEASGKDNAEKTLTGAESGAEDPAEAADADKPQTKAEGEKDAAADKKGDAGDKSAAKDKDVPKDKDESKKDEDAEAKNDPEMEVLTTIGAHKDDTVDFTSKLTYGARTFRATYDSTSYDGACAKAGVDASESGKGKVTGRYLNTSDMAKVIYYWVYYKEWWKDGTEAKNGISRHRFMCMAIQYAAASDASGRSHVKSEWSSIGFSSSSIEYAIDRYEEAVNSNVTVPDSFEAFRVAPNDESQPLVFWDYQETGFAAVKKVSGSTSITG